MLRNMTEKSVMVLALIIASCALTITGAFSNSSVFAQTASNPIISIMSPSNETYNTNKVTLIVIINNASDSDKTEIKLDGISKGQLFGSDTFKLDVTGLSEGSHQIETDVHYHMWVVSGVIYGQRDTRLELVVKRQFVSFTVHSSSPTPSPSIEPSPSVAPSPSPTSAPTIEPTTEPTIVPTSTPSPQSGFLGTSLPTEYGYAIIAVLIIAVVAGLSFVYLKRLRKQKVNG
jgi:hypothetical protein